ncbi:MAG TPA: tetratricopeptide repeat protein [Longimicrobiales bacterium]
MAVDPGVWHRLRSWAARHETAIARSYLLALLLGVGLILFPPTNRLLLSAVESGVDAWDGRWTYRVEHGMALVSAGRYEEAVPYLEELDASFPARNVRHARDQDRERILRALGQSYEQLGRKGRALDTYRRAVLFDPLNYVNHEALARAALVFDEPEEALVHLRQILALKPAYLPAVAAVVELQFADADWSGIVQTYRDYLESFLVQHLIVELGDTTMSEPVIVDGRFHEVRIPLSRSTAAALAGSGLMGLGPGPHGLEVRRIVVEYPLPAGALPAPEAGAEPPPGSPWSLASAEAVPTPAMLSRVREPAVDPYPGRRVWIPLPGDPATAAAVRLELRLMKPVDAPTWTTVAMAHRNLLEFAVLDSIHARSFASAETRP